MIALDIVALVIVYLAFPSPDPIAVASKNNVAAEYPDPPVIISTLDTPPPETTILAVAPFHDPAADPFNNLTFWNVPLV